MYELIILSLLMHWNMHGYYIGKIANEIIGPWEKISRGTMYTLLAKMARAGLVEQTSVNDARYQTSDRASKGYSITEAGRERFRELMLDTTNNLSNYKRLMHIKAAHLEFLTLEQQLFLVDHYLVYCQTAINHQQQELREMEVAGDRERMGSSFYDEVIIFMHFTMETWRSERIWAEQLRQRVLSRSTDVENPFGKDDPV